MQQQARQAEHLNAHQQAKEEAEQRASDQAQVAVRRTYQDQFLSRYRPQPQPDQVFPPPFMDVPGPRDAVPAWVTTPYITFSDGGVRALHALDAGANQAAAKQNSVQEQLILQHNDQSLSSVLEAAAGIHELHRGIQAAPRK